MITYTGYSTIISRMVAGWKGHSFTLATNHVCAINGDKWLKFDNVGVLSLSLDGGSTYPITLDLTGVCDIITHAEICSDGTIGWANHTKCFYSEDNLSTYHESTLIGVDGNPWVAGTSTYDNFKPLSISPDITVNGVTMKMWGTYSLHATQYNAWYTIDSWKTIKSCFKDNSTIGGQNFDHIHGFSYNPIQDKFYLYFGDGLSGVNTNTYNWLTDTWGTWTNLVSEDGSGYHKITGMQFHDGYTYFASDSTDVAKHGIWKCADVDFGVNVGNYTKIRTLESTTIGLFGENGIMITCRYSSTVIHISYDYGVTWESHDLVAGGPAAAAGYMFFAVAGGDNVGYYRADIQENPATEPEYDSAKGITLLIQAYSNKVL